jgi:NitT/TauT family transport system permease protein
MLQINSKQQKNLTIVKAAAPRTLGLSLGQLRGVIILPSILLALAAWQTIVMLGDFPAFILPGPALVWKKGMEVFLNGTLLLHTSVTLLEVLSGLIGGSLLATVLAYWLAKYPLLEELVSPYLVAYQAIPIVALAPLLVIWFGPGIFSKSLISGLIVFFPVLINTVVGLKAVPVNLRDLLKSMKANRWQTLRYLELPSALPVMLGGLRIGATLSVIGAVVGEFVGSNRGLGYLINVGRGQYDTALVFVAVFTLIVLALCLYGFVILLEHAFLSWRKNPHFD